MAIGTIRTALAGLAIVCGWGLTATAQENANWATRMFDETSHDFGVVARGSDTRHQLRLKNIFKKDAHITKVSTTCGCISAEASKTTLSSLEEGYIEVTLDTRRHTHQKDSNVLVSLDVGGTTAEVRIAIHAYIRTDVVLTPGSADFGAVDHSKGAARKIDIAYAGRNDWTIREVRTSNMYLDAKVVEKSRGGGHVAYELVVALSPTAPVGNHSQQIVLVTDDANSPYVPVLVNARVESDMSITPIVTIAGGKKLTPGRAETFNVVIRGRAPFMVESIECKSATNAFAVRMPQTSKIVHVLPITFTPPNAPGKYSEEFVVTIAGRAEPLHFKAFAEIGETAEN